MLNDREFEESLKVERYNCLTMETKSRRSFDVVEAKTFVKSKENEKYPNF